MVAMAKLAKAKVAQSSPPTPKVAQGALYCGILEILTRTTGMKCTGKKLIENMITTAINILATLRRVLSWLSIFRRAELEEGAVVKVLEVSPPPSLLAPTLWARPTNLMVARIVDDRLKW
jgi:hypothetical protein